MNLRVLWRAVRTTAWVHRPAAVRRVVGAVLVVLAGGACAGTPTTVGPEEEEPANALRVLFIGNSLTYTNDLPGVVQALADSARVERRMVVGTVAAPDVSLSDHWSGTQARQALRARTWDIVVLQQGASTLPQNQLHLKTWAERWAAEIRAAGARPALYMVWPLNGGDFDAVSTSYTNAAVAANGMLVPVGEAWREALRDDAFTPLYHPDGLHPSPYGTWLAGVVMLGVLYDVDVATAAAQLRTRSGVTLRIPVDAADDLRRAAAFAIENFARR